MSASKEIVWPPQTTQDVLNLTPRKNRSGSNANPPLSPSPLRRARGVSQLDPNGSCSDDSDADDDEETLKLKLAQIEAKLKLKKLQKQKKKAASASAVGERSPAKHAVAAQAVVQVPLSPTSKTSAARAPPSPKSPSRVLLGIDKGLTGRDMSLRRAPQYRNNNRNAHLPQRKPSPPRPAKTFSERIAEERAKDKEKFERNKRIEKTRSKGFGTTDETSSSSSSTSTIIQGDNTVAASNTTSSKTTAVQKASHTFTSVLNQFDRPLDPATVEALGYGPGTEDFTFRVGKSISPDVPDKDSKDEAGFDSYSGLHLVKRIMPHTTVCRHLSEKNVFQLPRLLKVVVSPDYEPPDVEGDWVTLGVICSKSDPRNVGQNTSAKATGQKYMVMTMCDLKWELELFLFGAGFESFWKIPIGTIVAILNPGVMKPRQIDSGKFSLTINDDMADSVLEIGISRDLGFCKSMKRDGKQCGTWIDSRHTSFCTFHVEQTVKKSRVGRAEVNSMSSLFSPPKKGSVKPRRFFGGGGGRGRGGGGGRGERDDGLLQEGPISDLPRRMGGAGGSIFVAPGRSTASLLDDESYLASGFSNGKSKEERLRQRLADSAKERELTKQLIAAQGREGGLGAEYLKKRIGMAEEDQSRRRAEHESNAGQKQLDETLASLRTGKTRDASSVRLSPIKRKRPQPPLASLPPVPAPAGILARPKSSGSTGSTDAPVAKKTRFVLAPNDGSDDDLDIVHE